MNYRSLRTKHLDLARDKNLNCFETPQLPSLIHRYTLQVENNKLLEWGNTMIWDSTKKFYDPKTTNHLDMIDDK